MSQTNSSSRLAPWQAMTMLAVGIAIIFFGLMALKVNARIVLAVDGAIMCLMACAFGISYDSVQKGIKDTIASMLVAMLILLSVGILIGSWMASGTIPVMVYYGMQVILVPPGCLYSLHVNEYFSRNLLGHAGYSRRCMHGRGGRTWYSR